METNKKHYQPKMIYLLKAFLLSQYFTWISQESNSGWRHSWSPGLRLRPQYGICSPHILRLDTRTMQWPLYWRVFVWSLRMLLLLMMHRLLDYPPTDLVLRMDRRSTVVVCSNLGARWLTASRVCPIMKHIEIVPVRFSVELKKNLWTSNTRHKQTNKKSYTFFLSSTLIALASLSKAALPQSSSWKYGNTTKKKI